MAKVFRLHQGQDGTGWFPSSAVTKEQLETIKTDGREVATSIPSPFARIDLVKSAFKWVANNELKGKTAHHRLVSDALDVAQLFFTSQKYSDLIEIVAWNPNERFEDLIENSSLKHSAFSRTLQLFWNQDSVPSDKKGNLTLYNFESVTRLYFLLNKETNQIIGGTSPASLFFAAPDVRRVTANLSITISQDRLFDADFASLGERDISFIEYMYALSRSPGFATYFPEVYSYLETISDNYLQGELRQKIANFDVNEITKYTPCTVLGNVNDPCEILGIPLGIQTIIPRNIENESDFVISNELKIDGLRPLVLPYHRFSNRWTYTTQGVIWDENTQVPYQNTLSPKESKLPVQNEKYFWLTIGNLFEDKIIELPYPIDETKFLTCGSKRHLLPLSPVFFEYFSVESVSKYLKIHEKSGGLIVAELRIPVKGGEITFTKNYSIADKNIEKLKVHLAVFPFFQSDNINITYNIGILDDRLEKNSDLSLQCFYKGRAIEVESPIIRNPGLDGELKSLYHKCSSQFDSIRFGILMSNGFVIPNFIKCNGNNAINFAVDFGTTNTHIEYQFGGNDATALDNNPSKPFWQSLLNRNATGIDRINLVREEIFEEEMLPYSFSTHKEQLKFPVRTALVYNQQINFNETIDIIREVNNYLLLDRRRVQNYLELSTQIKWTNYSDPIDEKKVESYIEFIMTLVLHKTLLLGGHPANTKIVWFYPVSMDEGELNVFFRIWKKVYTRVFDLDATDDKIIGIPESVAPYLFYKSSIAGLSLSIDIGGGSSDIAVFDEVDNNAILISSFKFAGNAIFGDGYPSHEYQNNSDRNGFVKTFSDVALTFVKGDDQREPILKSILNTRKNSSDFSSFLFSLEQETPQKFSYSRLLEKNKRLKLSILVFYGAIAYYSANLLKKAGIAIPKYILLSGTASKSASIIDASNDFTNLSALFEHIFNAVYQSESNNSIKIILSKIPKEITCKGSLKAKISNSVINTPVKFWIGGQDDNHWGTIYDKEKDVSKTPRYGNINDDTQLEIENSIKDFYGILDSYVKDIRLESKFIIEESAYIKFQEIRESGIKDYLIRGIKAYFKKNSDHIQESLFFYPLIGLLNKLSFELAQIDDDNV